MIRSLPAARPTLPRATLSGLRTSVMPQWPANFFKRNPYRVDLQARPASSSTTLTGSRGCERFPPYSRAAATDYFFVAPTLPEPANRLPEHEICDECGLRRSAAGLGWTRKLPASRNRTKL